MPRNRSLLAPFVLVVLAPAGALAQTPAGIQDNSFLIEEAYNQEAGVVQHIQTFQLDFGPETWSYGFTQEWPLGGLRHQLSYVVPVLDNGGHTGLGDVLVNYRYQLLGDGDAPLAIAPRVSVLLPTGKSEDGLGAGAAGVEVNLPVSAVLGTALVGHWNAGATWTPSAENAVGEEADTLSYRVGQGLIWLAAPRVHLMLEAVWSQSEEVSGLGRIAREESLVISPGVRWVYDLASGLQIVPGIAVPIGVGPSEGEESVFVYLSLEHPFR